MQDVKTSGLKLPLTVFLVSFAYYVGLCAKQWTWIFVSADSGDWLASSIWWFVPQPLGSPLFLLLGHFLNLFPDSLVLKETILLSCLPAAITVTLVYLTTTHLSSWKYGLLASLMTLGAGVVLSQSTVLEEYALAAMFLVLAYWLYLKNRQNLILVALGCGTAIHVAILPIVLFWFWIERKEWRMWLKKSWIYILFGIVPYLMIPILMMLKAPPLITGYWSITNLKDYVFNTAGVIVGQISVFDFPLRLLRYCAYILSGLGLGLIGILWSTSKPIPKYMLVLLMIVGFISWYYLTNLDPSTWTYLTYATPFIAVLATLGLSKVSKPLLVKLAVASSLLLVVFNSYWLNADLLTRAEPIAMQYKASLLAMPQNSVVLLRPGAYSIGLFYVMAESRPDLAPILFYENPDNVVDWSNYNTEYIDWLRIRYGLEGYSPETLIANALSQGRAAYIAEDYSKAQFAIANNTVGMENWAKLLSILTIERSDSNVREIASVKQSS